MSDWVCQFWRVGCNHQYRLYKGYTRLITIDYRNHRFCRFSLQCSTVGNKNTTMDLVVEGISYISTAKIRLTSHTSSRVHGPLGGGRPHAGDSPVHRSYRTAARKPKQKRLSGVSMRLRSFARQMIFGLLHRFLVQVSSIEWKEGVNWKLQVWEEIFMTRVWKERQRSFRSHEEHFLEA